MIPIIDFGSQYTHLLCRRIRELGVKSEIIPYTRPLPGGKELDGIILSGSPSSLKSSSFPKPRREVFTGEVPVLGICYGMQVMTKMLGGKLGISTCREYGKTRIEIIERKKIFESLPKKLDAWMSHYDGVETLPEGFRKMASTSSVKIAAMGDYSRNFYGVQFHPEVTHTARGLKILENFVDICGASRDWNLSEWIDDKIDEIRSEVKNRKVIMALSGGVDSSVASVLIQKAIGENFYPIFVEHGLTRWKDSKRIKNVLMKKMGINVRIVDASGKFMSELKGVRDPEEKRKIIGREFINVFHEEADKLEGITHLAQGTLYPDVIESAKDGESPARIKSHHNVGGLPEVLNLKLLEPFKALYKDEVREIGLKLGVPEEIVKQHPFPGPGLAVRTAGEVTEERVEILRKSDEIVDEELKKAGVYYNLWQAFPVFLPVKSVGVMGDKRTYEYTLAIRCVESKEAMTASWARIPYGVLGRISTRVVNEVEGINRVVYDITNKPPGTIEWE